MKKLIVVLGPTASGKTELSLKLAKKFGGEIINADSRTIYKELDIGTDKPLQSKNEKVKSKKGKQKKEYIVKEVPHHLIDFLEPLKIFSVAKYQKLASKKIKEIQAKGKIPFLVGGSPLYIDSVIYEYKIPKVKPDYKLREKLEKESEGSLVSKLERINPEALESVDLKNKRRVIRALEIVLKSKKSLRPASRSLSKNILVLGIKTDREKLYKKINQRVELMMKKGLIKEVENLVKKYGNEAPALSGIGYRQIVEYLQGETSSSEALELVKRDSRRFAKRQLTWFRRNKNIKWVSNQKQAEKLIHKLLKN